MIIVKLQTRVLIWSKLEKKRANLIKLWPLTFNATYVLVQEFQLTIPMLLLQRLKCHMTPSKLNGCEDRQNRQNLSRNLSIIPTTVESKSF